MGQERASVEGPAWACWTTTGKGEEEVWAETGSDVADLTRYKSQIDVSKNKKADYPNNRTGFSS